MNKNMPLSAVNWVGEQRELEFVYHSIQNLLEIYKVKLNFLVMACTSCGKISFQDLFPQYPSDAKLFLLGLRLTIYISIAMCGSCPT
jgi:hypothetical protein